MKWKTEIAEIATKNVELPSYMGYLKKSTDYNYSFNDNIIIIVIILLHI